MYFNQTRVVGFRQQAEKPTDVGPDFNDRLKQPIVEELNSKILNEFGVARNGLFYELRQFFREYFHSSLYKFTAHSYTTRAKHFDHLYFTPLEGDYTRVDVLYTHKSIPIEIHATDVMHFIIKLADHSLVQYKDVVSEIQKQL